MSLPFDAVTRLHPSLHVVASADVRAAVLGWADNSWRCPGLTASLASVTRVGGEGEEKDGSTFKSAAAYCCVETLGKASYSGMTQHHLALLLSMPGNTLHPTLQQLRTRHLLVTASDRGKNRLWLRHWKARGDGVKEVREDRQRLHEDWLSVSRTKWRAKRLREQAQRPSPLYLSPPDDDATSLHTSYLSYNAQPTPALKLNLSFTDQLYRLIESSGTKGVTTIDLREALGTLGLKGFDRLLGSMAGMDVVSVTDRQGKSFVYRFLTRPHYEEMKKQHRAGAKETKEGGTEEEKEGKGMEGDQSLVGDLPTAERPFPDKKQEQRVRERLSSNKEGKTGKGRKRAEQTVTAPPPLPSPPETPSLSPPTAPSAAPVTDPAPEEGKVVPRAPSLLVMRRRQTALRLLAEAPHQMLSFPSLDRSLAALHPPQMTRPTFKSFLASMADMGSLVVHTFLFPGTSGRPTHTVQVVAARKERLNEEAMEERRMRAYELATQVKEERSASNRVKEEPLPDESTAEMETERKEGKSEGEEAEVKDGEEVVVVSGPESEASTEVKRPIGSDLGLTDGRALFGMIRPVAARTQYLHRQLWTEYQGADNQVVFSPSPGAPLTFRYIDLVKQLYLKDYLLISGLPHRDQQEPPFLRDSSLLNLRLDRLPPDIQRWIEERELRCTVRYKGLVQALELLGQLHLIEPLLEGAKSSVQLNQPATTLHSQYTLTPSFSGAAHQLSFSSPTSLTKYWDALRDAALQGVAGFDLSTLTKEWRVSAVVLSRLRRVKCWKYRLQISEEEMAQLRDLDKAVREFSPPASMLSIAQVMRAANLASTSGAAAATLYSRDHFPQLAAVHDSLLAFELTIRRTRRLREPHEVKKKRRTQQQMAELREQKEAEDISSHEATSAPAIVGDVGSSISTDQPQRRRRGRKAITSDKEEEAEDETGEDNAEAAPVKARRRTRRTGEVGGRRRSRQKQMLWTPKEEEELIVLYNEWLEGQRQNDQLPFTFTPPPKVDALRDEGLPFAFAAPTTSSASPFAASFHTLLPLMWLDQPPPPDPLPPEVEEEDGGAAAAEEERTAVRDPTNEEILQARREFVLHSQPLPKEAHVSVQDLFRPVKPPPTLPCTPPPTSLTSAMPPTSPTFDAEEDEDEKRSEHSKEDEEKEKEGAVDEEGKSSEQKEEGGRRPLHFASSSSLLLPFYSMAEGRLVGRASAFVRRRLDLYRTRLTLPVGLSSATRRRPILSTPYTSTHLAHDPLLMALCALIKSIILQPDDSYSSQHAHLCTRHFSQRQVQVVIAALRGDRLIRPRKGNKEGAERGWALTAPAAELFYGKREENNSRRAIDQWVERWQKTPLGHVVQLDNALNRSQAEAVLSRTAHLDFDVLTTQIEEAEEGGEEEEEEVIPDMDEAKRAAEAKHDERMMEVEAREEAREETKEETKEGLDGMEVEGEQKAEVDGGQVAAPPKPKVRALRGELVQKHLHKRALKAAIADLTGPSVSLLSTTWQVVQRADSELHLSTTTPSRVLPSDLQALDAVSDDSSFFKVPLVAPKRGRVDDLIRLDGVDDEDEDEDIFDVTDRLLSALTAAGPAGLTADDIAGHLGAVSLLVQRSIRLTLRSQGAVRVLSHDAERFVAREFADWWTFPDTRDSATRRVEEEQWRLRCREARGGDVEGEEEVSAAAGEEEEDVGRWGSAVMAHPWRLMGGDVNEEVWVALYESILHSVREWPGVQEERLMDMHPILTPMEFRHVVGTLLLDDRICKRSWTQRRGGGKEDGGSEVEKEMAVEGDEEGSAQECVVTCYFPLHLCEV